MQDKALTAQLRSKQFLLDGRVNLVNIWLISSQSQNRLITVGNRLNA